MNKNIVYIISNFHNYTCTLTYPLATKNSTSHFENFSDFSERIQAKWQLQCIVEDSKILF